MKDIVAFPESKRLIALERIVEKGKKVFIEVGCALAEIRDAKLYKIEHDTFEDYCRERWGFSKRYAYMLIESSAVVKSLPESVGTIVHTESQARELAKIADPEKRVEVLEAVASRGEVTARAIREEIEPPRVRTADEVLADQAAIAPPAPTENHKYTCDSCGETFDDASDAEPIYECGDCGSRFTPSTSDYGNHKCSCGKFGSKVSEMGCPSCGEGELLTVEQAQEDQLRKLLENAERLSASTDNLVEELKPFLADGPELTRDSIKIIVAINKIARTTKNRWAEVDIRTGRKLGHMINEGKIR